MNDTPRFHRVLLEVEVEVVDEVQARASTLFSMQNDDGDPQIYSEGGIMLVPSIVSRIANAALIKSLPACGLQFVSSGAVPRVAQDGLFPEIVYPAVPADRDDGDTTRDALGE